MIATQSNTDTLLTNPIDVLADKKHCVFHSGGQWFAIPAVVVREITASPKLVQIPGCHAALAGICHLRSEFIPAISINGFLNVAADQKKTIENTLLVIDGEVTWALLIAEAGSIETLEVIGGNKQPQDTSGPKSPVVELGTAIFGDQMLRVLDHTGIYQYAQQLIEHAWGRSHDPTVSHLTGPFPASRIAR